jgi:hypothetical protein
VIQHATLRPVHNPPSGGGSLTSSLSDLTPWGEPDRLRARFDRSSRILPR